MRINHLLTDGMEVRVVGAPITAGSSIDGNSSRIDMAGYESVVFIAPIEDSVDTGVATLTVEENDVDSDTGMATATVAGDNVEATDTSAANDDLNGGLLVVEYRHPAKRYVQAVRKSATANIAYGTLIALLTPRTVPAVNGATVLDKAAFSN